MFFWFFPYTLVAHALTVETIISRVNSYIINPIILLLMSVAFLVFVWGMVQFLSNQGSGEEKSIGEGKKHMMWGLIGLFIMISVFGIMRLIVSSLGLEGPPGTPIVIPGQ